MAEELYRIKPLEWRRSYVSWISKGLFGRKILRDPERHITASGVGGIYILTQPVGWDAWWKPKGERWQRLGQLLQTEAAVKAICEEHHRSRLMECLEKV